MHGVILHSSVGVQDVAMRGMGSYSVDMHVVGVQDEGIHGKFLHDVTCRTWVC